MIFLAEAFTRPKVMYQLGQARFQPILYLFHLAQHQTRADAVLQRSHPDRSARVFSSQPVAEYAGYPDRVSPVRRPPGVYDAMWCWPPLSAPTMGSTVRRSSCSTARPREPGSEEYLDSEKYEIKHWNRDSADSLKEFIARVNRIRRENRALQSDSSLRFHEIDNEQIICLHKTDRGSQQCDRRRGESRSAPCAVRLGNSTRRDAWTRSRAESYQAHDLLTGARFLWHGARNYVELNPQIAPGHILRLRRRMRREQDFDYFHVMPMKRRKTNHAELRSRRRTRFGTRTRSFMSCMCGRFPTATPTASAISKA